MPTAPATDEPPGSPALEAFRRATESELGAQARPWLDGLADLIRELAERWDLELAEGRAVGGALQMPGERRADPVTLRISYPDGWFAEETAALGHWKGDGAVRLLDHDPRGAQLLERLDPETPLRDEPNEFEALRIAADVLRKLWIPDPGGLTTVASEVRSWVASMPARYEGLGAPFERQPMLDAVELLRTYGPTQKQRVLLHGDLRLANVVFAGEDRWVAVNPKPLVGEAEFDVTALIRDIPEELLTDTAAGRMHAQRRFDVLSKELGCNRSRVKGWSFAIAIDEALWRYETGDAVGGAHRVRLAELLRGLAV